MSEARFAGVDWASQEHAVCVVAARGRIVEGRRYRHDEPGIRALCSRLVALVALERPDGLLIERLIDAGLSVVAVHPDQGKAMRPRYSVAGGKSDVFDGFVLAGSVCPLNCRDRLKAFTSAVDKARMVMRLTRAPGLPPEHPETTVRDERAARPTSPGPAHTPPASSTCSWSAPRAGG